MEPSTAASTPELGYDGASTSRPVSSNKHLVNQDAAATEVVDYDVETVERVYR